MSTSTEHVPQPSGAAPTNGAPTLDTAAALPPAKEPVGSGSAPLVAQLVALALICLGVVGVQHLLAQLEVVQSSSWLVSLADATDGLRGDSPLVLGVGVVAALLSLPLLAIVLRRRPRTDLELTSTTGVHLRPKDLRRVVEAAVDGTDAVLDAAASATRRKVRVTVTSVAGKDRTAEITEAVRSAAESALDALQRPPRLTVTVRTDES